MIDQYPAEMRPFIEAILAKPQDDAPVLIFADWLEENGNPIIAGIFRWPRNNFCRTLIDAGLLLRWLGVRYSDFYNSKLPPQVPAVGELFYWRDRTNYSIVD